MVLNVYMQGGVLTGILNVYAVAGRGDGVGDSIGDGRQGSCTAAALRSTNSDRCVFVIVDNTGVTY